MKHINISVYGRVQGVGFRNSAKHQARFLGIKGYVKNMPDGSVYIEAEGEEQSLREFIKWCRKGPQFAEIEEVKVDEGSISNFVGFDSKY